MLSFPRPNSNLLIGKQALKKNALHYYIFFHYYIFNFIRKMLCKFVFSVIIYMPA